MKRINRVLLCGGIFALASWLGLAARAHAQTLPSQIKPKPSLPPTVKPTLPPKVAPTTPHTNPSTTTNTTRPSIVSPYSPVQPGLNPLLNPYNTVPLLNPYISPYANIPGITPILNPFTNTLTLVPKTTIILNPILTNPYGIVPIASYNAFTSPLGYVPGYTLNPAAASFANPYGVVPVAQINPWLLPNTWLSIAPSIGNSFLPVISPYASAFGVYMR